LLEAWHDGSVIMVAAGDADFLAWANRSDDKLRINQLVLIECSYLFVKLVWEAMRTATVPPTSMQYRLELRRMTLKDKCILFPDGLSRFPSGAKSAPKAEASFDTTVTVNDDPGIPSYKLVAQVYRWFGFEDDTIPYTGLDERGKSIIDPTTIVNLNKEAF